MDKTIKFLGYAYSETAVSLTVTSNGNTLFSGSVPLSGTNVTQQETVGVEYPQAELFTFPVDIAFNGTMPMSIQVTGGTIVLSPVLANYNTWEEPIIEAGKMIEGLAYKIVTTGDTQWTIIGAPNGNVGTEFVATNLSYGTGLWGTGTVQPQLSPNYDPGTATGWGPVYHSAGGLVDCRNNVTIDGIAQSQPPDSGTYWWTVGPNSTIAFDLSVDAGAVTP
jgi:hypothetical protein